ARHLMQRGLAGAVGAPPGVRGDRGVARYVEHDAAPAFACGRGKRAQQRPGQPEWPEEVGRERALEVLAFGIGEERERHGSEAGRVVDEHVEPAAPREQLQRDRMDYMLVGDITADAERAR